MRVDFDVPPRALFAEWSHFRSPHKDIWPRNRCDLMRHDSCFVAVSPASMCRSSVVDFNHDYAMATGQQDDQQYVGDGRQVPATSLRRYRSKVRNARCAFYPQREVDFRGGEARGME